MQETEYRNRRAVQIENNLVRITATIEGGHIAEISDKSTGINPLWKPHWPSIEPSQYDPKTHTAYGNGNDACLLAGILGHNLCLDTFGPPSVEEAVAGIPVHGEASIALYDVSGSTGSIELHAVLSKSQIDFKRRIALEPDSCIVRISEEVENLSCFDRPIAWTQHVTLGAPFLTRGITQFRSSATKSKVFDKFNEDRGVQKSGAEFEWPFCPTKDGEALDLQVYSAAEASGGFTTHLMDLCEPQAWFLAWSPQTKLLFGYLWERADFPWLARWEENHLRTHAPWNGQELTCGLEFGVSPMVESRREMVTRGSLFGVPAFRWLPAHAKLRVTYFAFITAAESIPNSVRVKAERHLEFF